MTSIIMPLEGMTISSLIAMSATVKLSERAIELLDFYQSMSTEVWNGFADGEYICSWGLVAPTVFSTQAYIWMYATEEVREHQFLFVRKSQRVIEELLKRYDSIVGHCIADARQSQRWLRWLGAEFSEPRGNVVPFVIRRRSRG